MPKLYHLLFLGLPLLFVMQGCTTTRQIKPLEKGESVIHLSLGGPLTKTSSAVFPLPLIGLGYSYGLLRELDFQTDLHITEFLFRLIHFNVGVNYRPLFANKWAPGLILSGHSHFLWKIAPQDKGRLGRNFSFYPDLALTAYWFYKRHYFYFGWQNWFELRARRNDGLSQQHFWFPTLYLGYHLALKKTVLQFELKWYVPNLDNRNRPMKNIGLGNRGILGIFLGSSFSLPKIAPKKSKKDKAVGLPSKKERVFADHLGGDHKNEK